MGGIVDRLLASDDPCIRYRTLVEVCGRSPRSREVREAQAEITDSARVKTLLSRRDRRGRILGHAYAKYCGAHWVLADLADMGYPPGDPALAPLMDQVCEVWLSPEHVRERVVAREAARYKSLPGVPVIDGRARRCASQEGRNLHAMLTLGFVDERADRFAANLLRWQWPDGGWNCDRTTKASISSFHESLLPLRGLAWHARVTGSKASRCAAKQAAEIFLKRRLFRRLHGGDVIRAEFLRLRFPHYTSYDILMSLKVMAEAGFIRDPRCEEALNVLESKRLPDGGWRAEGKHYRVVDEPVNGGSLVDWGQVSRRPEMNPFVTLDALSVLRAAGRLTP